MTPLRLGTRGSPLALWQANHVADRLRPVLDPRPVTLVRIETEGDRVQDRPIAAMGGYGVFTKAIQDALLDRRIDAAVHSLKDLPTIPVPGLVLVAVPPAARPGTRSSRTSSRSSKTCRPEPSSARVVCGGGPSCSTAGAT